jgi:hypothetical protein
MRLHGILAVGLAGCSTLALAGCGGPVDVRGKVTLNGSPLAGATVVFIPESEGREAGALTDEEGNFQLTNSKTDGTLPGEYRVTVSKKEWPPGVTPPEPAKLTLDSMKVMREIIPLKYRLKDKTPFRITVPRGGTKDVNLALEK